MIATCQSHSRTLLTRIWLSPSCIARHSLTPLDMYNTDIRHTHLVFRHLLLLDSLPSVADNDWEEEGCVISHRQGVSISPLLKWMVVGFSYPVLNESCLTSMDMKIRRVCTSICRSYHVCINNSMRCLFSRSFVIVSIMDTFIRP